MKNTATRPAHIYTAYVLARDAVAATKTAYADAASVGADTTAAAADYAAATEALAAARHNLDNLTHAEVTQPYRQTL